MDNNNLFFQRLQNLLDKTKYGPIKLNLQVHNGQVTQLWGDNFSHRKYKNDGSSESVAEFLNTIKDNIDNKKTGEFTVTFSLHNGQVKEMTTHTNYSYQLADNE